MRADKLDLSRCVLLRKTLSDAAAGQDRSQGLVP